MGLLAQNIKQASKQSKVNPNFTETSLGLGYKQSFKTEDEFHQKGMLSLTSKS